MSRANKEALPPSICARRRRFRRLKPEEGYVPEAAMRAIGRPQPRVQRFREAITLPADADLEKATIAPACASSELQVRVRRLQERVARRQAEGPT